MVYLFVSPAGVSLGVIPLAGVWRSACDQVVLFASIQQVEHQ